MLRSIALLTFFFSYYAVKKITFCAMIIISTKNVKQLKSENNNRDCISFLFRRIEVWPQMSRSLSIQFFQLQKDYCDMFHFFFTISIKWSWQHCKFTFPNITTQKSSWHWTKVQGNLNNVCEWRFLLQIFHKHHSTSFHYCKCTQKYIQYNIHM